MELSIEVTENNNYNTLKKVDTTTVKPFLKWAGGKTQILNEIEKNLPIELADGKIKKYVEPFVGSGAVLFYLISKYKFEEIYINDNNDSLINLYKVIKNQIYEFLEELESLKEKYFLIDDEKKSEFFYEIREKFNNNTDGNLKQAAYLIFLNKTCFNGLYRVNKKGKYNVPFGQHFNPKMYDKENLINISKLLRNVNIINIDFEKTEEYIDEKTFVYFDPPYRPLKGTQGFNSYHKEPFNDVTQKRLADYFSKLNNKNAKLMLSNSDPKNTDESDNFFDELYNEFKIQRISANRMINSKGNGRGAIKELLITNYTM